MTVGRTPLVPTGAVTDADARNWMPEAALPARNSNHPFPLATVTVREPSGAPSAAVAVTVYVPFGT